MGIRSILSESLGVVNSILGVPCQYKDKVDPIYIFINKDNEIKDSHGMLAGYSIEGKINKSDVPDLRINDSFIDDEGTKYRITYVTKETSVSYYVSLVVIDEL